MKKAILVLSIILMTYLVSYTVFNLSVKDWYTVPTIFAELILVGILFGYLIDETIK